MKIGPLEVAWRIPEKRRDDQAAILSYLATHPEARAIVAKMARSEVKNWLAELAEAIEMPFDGDAAIFLQNVAKYVAYGKEAAK